MKIYPIKPPTKDEKTKDKNACFFCGAFTMNRICQKCDEKAEDYGNGYE